MSQHGGMDGPSLPPITVVVWLFVQAARKPVWAAICCAPSRCRSAAIAHLRPASGAQMARGHSPVAYLVPRASARLLGPCPGRSREGSHGQWSANLVARPHLVGLVCGLHNAECTMHSAQCTVHNARRTMTTLALSNGRILGPLFSHFCAHFAPPPSTRSQTATSQR